MNELQVIGTQDFMEREIPVIEGGFGENQKVILAKTIAEIHGVELRKINELINNNIDEFEDGIDILDLKGDENFAILAKDNGFYTQNALNASSNIYLLSEQGYMLLVGFMKSDKAKEIRKELRRNYFKMREMIKQNKLSLEQELALKVFEGGMTAIEANKILNKVHYDRGYNLGFDNGIEEGKTIKEKELYDKIRQLENGNEIKITQQEIADELNKIWYSDLVELGVKSPIVSTDISNYLVHEGLLIEKVFQAKSNGKLAYDEYGNPIMEKKKSKQPTTLFNEWVSGLKYSITSKADIRGKQNIVYTIYFLERLVSEHKERFFTYMVNKYK